MSPMSPSSFTAAGIYPIKVAMNPSVVKGITQDSEIHPVHAQIIPTNRCNLHCAFCSCRDRNSQEELPIASLVKILDSLDTLGCEALTITGGGEPLLHPEFGQFLREAAVRGMQMGLVTNGILLPAWSPVDLGLLSWCRVSCADDRRTDFQRLAAVIGDLPSIDWAFSYVLSHHPDLSRLAQHIKFANEHGFTHVRVVPDLTAGVDDMELVVTRTQDYLERHFGLLERVIFQHRLPTCGTDQCLISLLKPVISADGWVYPCCGVQYARDQPLAMGESYRMCHTDNMVEYWKRQKVFNGRRCVRCHYEGYNNLLTQMGNITHRRFV